MYSDNNSQNNISNQFFDKTHKEFSPKKKSKIVYVVILGILGITIAALALLFTLNTTADAYTKQVKLGYKLIDKAKYADAIKEFDKAIKMKDTKSEAYIGKIIAMAHDPEMTLMKVVEIADVVQVGYEKSKDEAVIESGISAAEIIKENGFIKESDFLINSTDLIKQGNYTPGISVEDEFVILDNNSCTHISDNKIITADDSGVNIANTADVNKKQTFLTFEEIPWHTISWDGSKDLAKKNNIESIATNGKITYYFDNKDYKLYELDIDTKEKKLLFSDINIDKEKLDTYGSLNLDIVGYSNGYIYLAESYGYDSTDLYYYNTKTGEYKRLGLYSSSEQYAYQNFSNFTTYKDKIFFEVSPEGVGGGWISVALYEANNDFSESHMISDAIGDWLISENMLYYSIMGEALSEGKDENIFKIKARNLISKEETILSDFKSDSWDAYTRFSDFGYIYCAGKYDIDTGEEYLSYGLVYFDGRKESIEDYYYGAYSDEYFIIVNDTDYSTDRSTYIVVTEDSKSKPLILSNDAVIEGYSAGIVYYRDNWESNGLKTLKIEFEN